jgi:hypothetical protein
MDTRIDTNDDDDMPKQNTTAEEVWVLHCSMSKRKIRANDVL